MIEPNADQLAYLKRAGDNTGTSGVALINPEGVSALLAAVEDGRYNIVGSCLVGAECLPEVTTIIEVDPAKKAGMIISGTQSKIHPWGTFIGTIIENCDVRADGMVYGGHFSGEFFNIQSTDPLEDINIEHGGHRLTIDRQGLQMLIDGVAVPLTGSEYRMLEMFGLTPRGQVIQRSTLLSLSGTNFDPAYTGKPYKGNHATDVHMSNLKAKLARHGIKDLFRTVRGVGFLMAPADSSVSQ